jgi:hypothetical protein
MAGRGAFCTNWRRSMRLLAGPAVAAARVAHAVCALCPLAAPVVTQRGRKAQLAWMQLHALYHTRSAYGSTARQWACARRQSFHLSKEQSVALTRLSRQEGITVFMTLVAGPKILLQLHRAEDVRMGTRLTGNPRILRGSSVCLPIL